MSERKTVDPVAVIFAMAYASVIGALVGRMMLRNEQAREHELTYIRERLWDLEHPKHPTPDILTTPEPVPVAE